MLFPTIDFAIFFCVVYIGAWLLNTRVVAWKLWLLAASYYFYAYWDWRFCFLLLASTVIAHVGATAISRSRSERARRAWLAAALVGLIGLLGYFKYYGFFSVNLTNWLSHVGLGHLVPLVTPTLPIAISFFTFMAISYVVDVYRGTLDRVFLGDHVLGVARRLGTSDRAAPRANDGEPHAASPLLLEIRVDRTAGGD